MSVYSVSRLGTVLVTVAVLAMGPLTSPPVSADGLVPPQSVAPGSVLPPSPAKPVLVKPDIAVTFLTKYWDNGTMYYRFQVQNIGTVPAKQVKVVKGTTHKYLSNHQFAFYQNQEITHATINPGEVQWAIAACTPTQRTYCTSAAVIVASIENGDANPGNNQLVVPA